VASGRDLFDAMVTCLSAGSVGFGSHVRASGAGTPITIACDII
jgi:hypothetical protein